MNAEKKIRKAEKKTWVIKTRICGCKVKQHDFHSVGLTFFSSTAAGKEAGVTDSVSDMAKL